MPLGPHDHDDRILAIRLWFQGAMSPAQIAVAVGGCTGAEVLKVAQRERWPCSDLRTVGPRHAS